MSKRFYNEAIITIFATVIILAFLWLAESLYRELEAENKLNKDNLANTQTNKLR